MKTLLRFLSVILVLLALSGCLSTNPSLASGGTSVASQPSTGIKWGQTGLWLAGKVASIALNGVIGVATGQTDLEKKSDWLDYGAQLARQAVSLDDFKALTAIWWPEKQHWSDTAVAAADAAASLANAKLTEQQRLEAIAKGLNAAAAAGREKAAQLRTVGPGDRVIVGPPGADPLIVHVSEN